MKITNRFPLVSDLDMLLNHINAASKEQTYILKQGYQFSKEEERDYLENLIKQIEDKKNCTTFGF